MTQHKMPLLDQIVNLFAVVIPFLATIAAIVLFWNQIVTPLDLALFLGMYMLTTFGITIGFHRLLTHRSFQTFKPIEYFLAIAGSMAVEGPVNTWVADHRKHHAHTDEEGDPHSPHVGHGGGIKGVLKGLFHAHIGWTFTDHGKAEQEKYAKDLYEDRGMRFISDFFVLWVVLGLLIPAGIGYLVTGTLAGAASGFLWGGLVRVFFVHHVTFSINSVCHFLGTRRFEVDDYSTNVFWLALPSMGEAWHHNHHAFPRSANHGLKKWELDPSAWVITAMERTGLARNVVRISPERQEQKLMKSHGSEPSTQAGPGSGVPASPTRNVVSRQTEPGPPVT